MSKRNNMCVAVAAAIASIGYAQAQTSAPQLEEVLVTAERRAESVQDVPVAVSAFSANEMDRRQIVEADDIIRNVPNLMGSNNVGLGTANAYFIRGLGNGESISTFDPPVGTYVDDVFIARQSGNNLDLVDVERIEVLRGPQGILFGRNTTGGAINIISRAPSDEFYVQAEAAVGDYAMREGKLAVNLPVTDSLFFKLNAFKYTDDGYSKNIYTGQDDVNAKDSWGVRGDVLFTPNDFYEWRVSLEHTEGENSSVGSNKDIDGLYDVHTFTVYKSGGDPIAKALEGIGTPNQVENLAFTSRMSFAFDAFDVDWIAAYRSLDQLYGVEFVDWNPTLDQSLTAFPFGYTIASDGGHEQVSQEVKANGDLFDGRLRYVAGLFYMTEDNVTDFADILGDQLGIITGVPAYLQTIRRDMENDMTTLAVYSQLDYAITDRWTGIVGARWTDEEKNLDYSAVTPGGTITNADIEAQGYKTRLKTTEVTPKFGLEFAQSDDLLWYATATKGFKSGGWNARGTSAADLNDFGPEFVWSYELGSKMEFMDNRARLNSSLFYAQYDDLQIPTLNPNDEFVTDNAGDAEVTGLELEGTFLVHENFSVFANVGLLDTELVSVSEAASGAGISKGNKLSRSPGWTGQIGGTYHFPLENGELFVAGDLSFSDAWFMGIQNSPETEIEYDGILNLAVGYQADDNRYSVALECGNCTDEIYPASELFEVWYPTAPRTLVLRLRYNYR